MPGLTAATLRSGPWPLASRAVRLAAAHRPSQYLLRVAGFPDTEPGFAEAATG
jgi:hypothetical protein